MSDRGREHAPALDPASVASNRSVALIATGDELVAGTCVDTNSSALARTLGEHGWVTRRIDVLGDDEGALVELLRELCARHAVVIVTGGLGPTLDDVTRHAVARAAGMPLVLDAAVVQALRALFESRGRPFAVSNERQALFPAGATILDNPLGTAPGFELAIDRARVFALPGPPREMQAMVEAHVLPRLIASAPAHETRELKSFYLFGLAESAFADQAGAWMARDANPLIGVTAHGGVLSVRLCAVAANPSQARLLCEARSAAVRERFGSAIFSESEADPAFALGKQLIARGISIATAESCTGGLVAEKLTRVPGISSVFGTGIVSYSNEAKEKLLGVDPRLIEKHGAVSSEVAQAMARGVARASGARIAVSVTGIAGPEGGSHDKPVGLVWFALSCDGEISSEERRFIVRGRDLIREFAANTALDLVRRHVPASID